MQDIVRVVIELDREVIFHDERLENPSRVFESRIPLATFDLAIGLKKGEQRLMDKLNAWITENVKNGKLNAIYKKFHGVELPADMRS